jgi:hypothetical protein
MGFDSWNNLCQYPGMIKLRYVATLSDMAFLPCHGEAGQDHIIMSFMPCAVSAFNMSYLPHHPKMCDMSFLPYGPNLVAYATIVDATISAQVPVVHDPAGWLAKNLSGFQKSARCGRARLPVTMGNCNMIRLQNLSFSYFDLRQFSATFSVKYETFSLFASFRPVQAAN